MIRDNLYRIVSYSEIKREYKDVLVNTDISTLRKSHDNNFYLIKFKHNFKKKEDVPQHRKDIYKNVFLYSQIKEEMQSDNWRGEEVVIKKKKIKIEDFDELKVKKVKKRK